MTLYNLIDIGAKNVPRADLRDNPSYASIGSLPFSRLYLVSRDRAKAQEAANQFNQYLSEQGENVDFVVQPLSLKGRLRFYDSINLKDDL